MAFAIPLIGLAGSVIQGASQQGADDANAAIYNQEARTARAQGYEAEATQRRHGALELGAARAGAGQAGAGYGGSTGRAIGQSSLNAELDALNIRYKQNLQSWSYDTQASNLRQEGKNALVSSGIRAGASLLKGYSNYGGVDLS